jgi:tRNA A-37 threonylcarbamoyl transferase component Bud32
MFQHNNTNWGMSVMDKIDMISTDYLKNPLDKVALEHIYNMILSLLQILCDNNVTHGDLHWENIAFMWDVEDNHVVLRPMIIDFGWSTIGKECFSGIEILQLLRTLNPMLSKKINDENRKFLHNKLFELFKSTYDSNAKRSFEYYDKEFTTLHGYYQKYIYFTQ